MTPVMINKSNYFNIINRNSLSYSRCYVYFVFFKKITMSTFGNNDGQGRMYSPNTGQVLYLISWFRHAENHNESIILTYVRPNSDQVHILYYIILHINGFTERYINLLKTKCNLLYIKNQFVPRCKHFPPRL